MKRKLRVKPIRSRWGSQAHLGPYANWTESQQLEIGLNLATVILGLEFRWGKFLLDETETHKTPEFELGSEYVFTNVHYRYGRAGEDLKPGTFVEADLAGRIAPAPEHDTVEITNELIWGNVKAAKDVDQYGTNVLGWPVVNVKKGRYCWLKQPPPGAEFKKEKD